MFHRNNTVPNSEQNQPDPAPNWIRPQFVTTHWSVVLSAGQEGPEAPAALERLCKLYWTPLYIYARRDGLSSPDAQDAVQEFIAQLLKRDDLKGVSPEKGRFRTFLLTALRNFLISRARREQAQKRGGGKPLVCLDADEAEAICAPELADQTTPAKAFDRRWAKELMARALEQLRAEHRSPSQARLFGALQPMLADSGRISQESALAAELGVTAGALAVAATRLRRRYRELIEVEVRQTLANPADLAEEMRALREAWK
jgi:RNA polymerase sigma-70 factor (ECF subfamily)